MGWPVTIPKEQRPEIARNAIARYLDGEKLDDIAKGHGVTRMRLNQILLETCEEEWKQAQTVAAINRLQDSEQSLEAAETMLSVARERELAKISQWKLERLCRRIYGTDPPVQVNINMDLGNMSERIADLERELLGQVTIQGNPTP